MRWISTRTTRTPHLSVASSRISRSSSVDRVAGGQRLVELHVADEVPQVGLGQLGDGQHEVGDVVDEALGVGGLVVDDGVDRDDDVVLGDDLLGRHVDHLLAHVDQAGAFWTNGHDQAQAGVDRLLVLAELLDDAPLVGPHDA